MTSLRALSLVSWVMVLSCSGGDDSVVSGGSSSDTSTAEATSATSATTGGSESFDPEVTCTDYCASWLACDAPYPSIEACKADCLNDLDTAALAGPACLKSYQGLLHCVTDLSCEDQPNWPKPNGPCGDPYEAAANDC